MEIVAGLQPELSADVRFDCRVQMRVGANRAGNFADGDRFAGALEPFEGAAEFVIHQRQFEPERDRLSMDAVGPADHRHQLVFLRLGGDDGAQLLDVLDEDIGSLDHLDGEGGIAHVG